MRNRTLQFFGVLTFLALLLSGCASIPTGGDVGKVQNSPTSGPDNLNIGYNEQPPAPNASQRDIVMGFLNAATGLGNNFQVARQYLTNPAAAAWKSSQRTVVYTESPEIVVTGNNGPVSANLKVQSVVDANGVRTPSAPGAVESLKFTLVQVSGQWRINSLPDGIALATNLFIDLFKHYALYFYDPGFNYLVPDVRWLPGKGDSVAISIVKALLDGPATYLKGAVASAFPDSIRLESASVPIENSVATIDLSAKPLLDASQSTKLQMQNQLVTTLQSGLNTVTSVRMRAGSDQIVLTADPLPADKLKPPVVSSRLIGISNNDLAYLDGSAVGPVAGLSPVAPLRPSNPAQSYRLFADGGSVAFLNPEQTSLYTIAPTETVRKPVTGQKLTPPSFSPSNWVWTAAGDGSGNVYAVHPGGQGSVQNQMVSLNIDWLKGRTVTSFRISRDGTRAMVVSTANGQSRVQLTGILRQDTTAESAPRDLTDPGTIYLSTTSLSQGYWAGESSFVVVAPGDGEVTPLNLELTQDGVQLPTLNGLAQLAVGNGVNELYALNTKGTIFTSTSSSWSESNVKGISDLAFSG